jgi:hypothetical protein
MRPSMTDNVSMRLIFEELHLLTDKDEYKLWLLVNFGMHWRNTRMM